MVVKTRLVLERLHALNEYIRLLEPYREWDIQRLTKDQIVYGGVLHYLQLSAQVVMDVSAHLQVELGLERVSDYRGAILSLSKAGALPLQFAERVSALAGFRNILVHEYLIIDPLKVSEALHGGLDDLRAFVMHITDFLRREGYLQGDR